MDLTKVFNNLAPNVAWTINDNNYDTITWDEKKGPKPTYEECLKTWEKIKPEVGLNKLRKIRDDLLRKSDKYMICDWPHKNEEEKQKWIKFRQELRDLPANVDLSTDNYGNLINIKWPKKPI